MIRSTFCHIPGVGEAGERNLWAAGVRCWDDVDRCRSAAARRLPLALLSKHIEASRRHLEARDCRWFAGALPASEQWRLFGEFHPLAAYIDIETTGLSPPSGHVTTIALYDGRNIRHYVRGENLDQFARDIRDYELIVTFNGKLFDLPFLRNSMGLSLDQPHIDLRWILRGLGYRGGLKACEKAMGIDRGILEGVDGYAAVLLWRHYERTGDRRALETLLAYNICDVLNLEILLVEAYNTLALRTPVGKAYRMPPPTQPAMPFRPHEEIVKPILLDRWQRK